MDEDRLSSGLKGEAGEAAWWHSESSHMVGPCPPIIVLVFFDSMPDFGLLAIVHMDGGVSLRHNVMGIG